MPVVRGAIMGISFDDIRWYTPHFQYPPRCIHYNRIPDLRIFAFVTDKDIEEGFTYSKARYPGIIFRVYRCENCDGMVEDAIGMVTVHDLPYDSQRVRDCLVITTSHDGRRKK